MKKIVYTPGWMKAVLGFALIMTGLLVTFLVFRFIPVQKEFGSEEMDVLIYSWFALGIAFILYLVGLWMDKKHPYSLFVICLAIYLLLLAGIRVIYG